MGFVFLLLSLYSACRHLKAQNSEIWWKEKNNKKRVALSSHLKYTGFVVDIFFFLKKSTIEKCFLSLRISSQRIPCASLSAFCYSAIISGTTISQEVLLVSKTHVGHIKKAGREMQTNFPFMLLTRFGPNFLFMQQPETNIRSYIKTQTREMCQVLTCGR